MRSNTLGSRAALAAAAVLASGGGAAASPLAFSNTADSERFRPVARSGPTPVASVTLRLAQPSNVLVQFSSGATAETTRGCPCSIRAFLRMDGGAPQPVKRINLGAPGAVDGTGHAHDRQSLDGTLVFPAEAGTHGFELVVEQVTGTSADLRIYYLNLQAIAFPR